VLADSQALSKRTALALMGRYDEALSLYRQILPEQQARENVRILKENIKTIQ
jgi:hypothetical protein